MKNACFILLLAFAGCSTPTPSPVIQVTQESAAPVAKPWSDGQVTTYWLGRQTAGPKDAVIHEAHPMYRLEGAAQPQLATPAGAYYTPVASESSTNAAFAEYEALRAEAARTRDLIFKLTHASEELAKQADGLRRSTEANRLSRDQMDQLLRSSAALSNRLEVLDQRMSAPPSGVKLRPEGTTSRPTLK
jgi:hypothetical protein